ncbi:MAG: YgiQ family radical SAM protein [candidate division WOR-3 bacterium]
MTRDEMRILNWDDLDVVLVTGDAYVDHPAFGVAVIARVLIADGFRVGVIAQPRWDRTDDIQRLGRPRLFFGVTAGNVDSLVANLSPNGNRRKRDDYSPGGRAGLRPDRAVIVYSNLIRQAFKGVPLVIGGIEASLRRLAHYDYWSDSVRRSILVDSRADILCYGMAEAAVLDVAKRLRDGHRLAGIAGTCIVSASPPQAGCLTLPSYEQVAADRRAFAEAFRLWYRGHADPGGQPVVQQYGNRWVVQYPPAPPLSEAELDRIYELPYTRQAHPQYREPIPALETVRFSIISHRGCFGSCTFCSLSAHQGRILQSRSAASIVREARVIARQPDFRGHITDVGGPTANMYGASCVQMARGRVCAERECLFPRPCSNLKLGLDRHLAVLSTICKLKGVKLVTLGSGIRFDLVSDRYLEAVCRSHVSGQLRVAPEHVARRPLIAMRKYAPGDYRAFRRRFEQISRRIRQQQSVNKPHKKQYLVPYFISGHPGTSHEDALALAEHIVNQEGFSIRQVQQFTPLPMTVAATMWHTGLDPLTMQPVHVPKSKEEQRLQRLLLQPFEGENLAAAERLARRMGLSGLVRRLQQLRRQTGK